MTFGDRDGVGGFSVSPGAIVNTIAAATLGTLAWMVVTMSAEVATLKDQLLNHNDNLKRVEARIDPLSNSSAILQIQVRGNSDGIDTCKANDTTLDRQLRELGSRLSDLDRKVNDLDHVLQPPAIDRPNRVR